jgi:hypothetical protein
MNDIQSESTIRFGGRWWHWTLLGALYGVLMRVLFGAVPRPVAGVMSMAFLVVTPIVVGALTIYGIRDARPSILAMIFRPWISVALMLLGCAVSLLEGSICLVIMAPPLLAFGSLGGIGMGLVLRYLSVKDSHLKVVAILPLLVAIGEGGIALPNQELELRQSVEIQAPPHEVWGEILTARSIRPRELPFSLVHLMGVPKPVEGVNVRTSAGEIRYSKWERGVNFRAIVTQRIEDRSISWRYVFDGKSFPAGSMDEHVAIGGRYFDLEDTTFNLDSLPGGRTRLEIVAHHRVTSSINFYAVPVARLLGHDFIHTILTLYKNRSEQATHRS